MGTGNSRITKAQKQEAVDRYLSSTGANTVDPASFLDWLQDHPEDPVHPFFFSMDDEAAARQYRLSMARNFLSGLRLSVVVSREEEVEARPITAKVVVQEDEEVVNVPSFFSPIETRGKPEGGYEPWTADNNHKLVHEAGQALAQYSERYCGALKIAGIDVAPLEKLQAEIQIHLHGDSGEEPDVDGAA